MPTLKCRLCSAYTKTTEPVLVKRLNKRKFCVAGICAICGDTKYKFLNDSEVDLLSDVFFEMPIPNLSINTFVNKSKFVYNMVPVIFSIINSQDLVLKK